MNEIAHWKEKCRKAEARLAEVEARSVGCHALESKYAKDCQCATCKLWREHQTVVADLRVADETKKSWRRVAEKLETERDALAAELKERRINDQLLPLALGVAEPTGKPMAEHAAEVRAERDALLDEIKGTGDADYIAALTAQVARLRNALEYMHGRCNRDWWSHSPEAMERAEQALDETPSQSLSAVRDEVLDAAAHKAENYINEHGPVARAIARDIRAMKEAD